MSTWFHVTFCFVLFIDSQPFGEALPVYLTKFSAVPTRDCKSQLSAGNNGTPGLSTEALHVSKKESSVRHQWDYLLV